MNVMQRIHHFLLLAIPLLLLTLLLPFLLAFDSIMYWITRPTCLNCGSLGEYVRTSSLSAVMIGSMLSNAGQRYGTDVKLFFERMGWKWSSPVERKHASNTNMKNGDYQLKESPHE